MASFVMIELQKDTGKSTSWKDVIKSIDNLMESVPLNAPVMFSLNKEMVFPAMITASLMEHQNGADAILLFQFIDKNHPVYRIEYAKLTAECGISLPKKGSGLFG